MVHSKLYFIAAIAFLFILCGVQYNTYSQNSPQINISNADLTATDALGRTLPSYRETGGVKQNRYVGLFYWLWHGPLRSTVNNPDSFNVTKILASDPGKKNWRMEDYYWDEPENGYYLSADPWVMKRHLILIAEAGVDFIFLDLTNDQIYRHELKQLLDTIVSLRKSEIRAPYVVPFLNAEYVWKIRALYNEFYKPGHYDDVWFRWQGKPLVMCPLLNDTQIKDSASFSDMQTYFTWRPTWAFFKDDKENEGKWRFMDEHPQHPAKDAQGKPEQYVVSKSLGAPLWDYKTKCSSCGIDFVPSFDRQWTAKETGAGIFFNEQWNRAESVAAPVLLITGWNEWKAGAWPTSKDLAKKTYDRLLNDHVAFYQKYFNRVTLDLGTTDSINNPTDVRLANFSTGNDPQLVTLYFQYGRYLLISSSQPGGQAANLQGIWNDQMDPPWDSKYTININTEMNYWPAEVAGLPEMHGPLIKMVKELSESGRQTARDMYGAAGWVAHHNTDLWRITGHVDAVSSGMWPMGGVWLSRQVWDKYLYSGDRKYLQSVYPALKGAAQFCLDFLVEEPVHKWLVIVPSISPENGPQAHSGLSIAAGTTVDNQLVFELFSNVIQAAKILEQDPDLISKLTVARNRLPPMLIGQYGQLQEWLEDLDSPSDKNRHVSHLFGLYPSNQISPLRTPELFTAARTSLNMRGDISTGWSMGWKVNLWARLLDGDHAFKLITNQLTPAGINKGENSGGGTYKNLFDAHPPFQIDGNFGCTAGIAEMLMQSHDGSIFLLPALPAGWQAGRVGGLRTVGGFEITHMEWQDGQLSKLIIKSLLGGNCRLRAYSTLKLQGTSVLKPATGQNPNPFFETPANPAAIVSQKAKLSVAPVKRTFLYDLSTTAGKSYTLTGGPGK